MPGAGQSYLSAGSRRESMPMLSRDSPHRSCIHSRPRAHACNVRHIARRGYGAPSRSSRPSGASTTDTNQADRHRIGTRHQCHGRPVQRQDRGATSGRYQWRSPRANRRHGRFPTGSDTRRGVRLCSVCSCRARRSYQCDPVGLRQHAQCAIPVSRSSSRLRAVLSYISAREAHACSQQCGSHVGRRR